MEWSARQLYLIFTPDLCRGDPWRVLADAVAAGVQLVQWRAPGGDPAGLARCLELCDAAAVPVIVNDDVAAAVAAGAAGAHVGQDDMPARQARAHLRDDQVLGVSTHDLAQAQRAVADGADHIGIGPCFPTRTKGYTAGLAPATLRSVFAAVAVPAFAIGGITPERVASLRPLGCRRVAVSSAILGAPDVAGAVARFRAALA